MSVRRWCYPRRVGPCCAAAVAAYRSSGQVERRRTASGGRKPRTEDAGPAPRRRKDEKPRNMADGTRPRANGRTEDAGRTEPEQDTRQADYKIEIITIFQEK